MKKRNKSLFIFAFILMIISIGLISTGLLINFNIIKINTNNDDVEVIDEGEDVILEEEIDPSDTSIQELFLSIKGKEAIDKHKYLPEYLDSFYYKVSSESLVSSMTNDDLLKIMWFSLKDSDKKTDIENGFVVSVDDFKNTFSKIFGDSIEFSKDTTSTTAEACLSVNYNKSNDNYEFFNNCTSDLDIIVYSNITKAIKNDSEIKIYESVGFMNSDKLYSDIDLRNEITDSFKDDEIDSYMSSFSTFVYTFKIGSNGEYYFYSVSNN